MVNIRVVKQFMDSEENKTHKPGETIEVSQEKLNKIKEKIPSFIEEIEQPKKENKPQPKNQSIPKQTSPKQSKQTSKKPTPKKSTKTKKQNKADD